MAAEPIDSKGLEEKRTAAEPIGLKGLEEKRTAAEPMKRVRNETRDVQTKRETSR
jgi:hypothetical protein